MNYATDTNFYYVLNGRVEIYNSASSIPDGIFDDCCTIFEALREVQSRGCQGRLHQKQSSYYQNCLEVLRQVALPVYGERVETCYRGTVSEFTDPVPGSLIFASPSIEVAAFYGPNILIFHDIWVLKTRSHAKAVVTDDYEVMDEEYIFFC